MNKLLKRNQIIITALVIMIAVAGYINYISNINPAKGSKVVNNDEVLDIYSMDDDQMDSSLLEPGTSIMTSGDVNKAAVIAEVKINREQLRATNKEALYQIIDNTNLDDIAKQDAVNQVIKMTDISEKELAAELLLEAKGYGDCIVTIVDDNVDVVINTSELTDTQRVQIEDIVKRKTNVSADKIVITPINNLQ